MTKLSETQAAILVAAAQSDDGAIDAPADAKSAVAGLIKRGTPELSALRGHSLDALNVDMA